MELWWRKCLAVTQSVSATRHRNSPVLDSAYGQDPVSSAERLEATADTHQGLAPVAAVEIVVGEDTVRFVDCTCLEATEHTLAPSGVDYTAQAETSAIPCCSPAADPAEVLEVGLDSGVVVVGKLMLVRYAAHSEHPWAVVPTSEASWNSAEVPLAGKLTVSVAGQCCCYSTRKDFGWAEALEHVLAGAPDQAREEGRPFEEDRQVDRRFAEGYAFAGDPQEVHHRHRGRILASIADSAEKRHVGRGAAKLVSVHQFVEIPRVAHQFAEVQRVAR